MSVKVEHKHLIIRAEVESPPKDEAQISADIKDLIQSIDMKILMGPYAKYVEMPGNRGLTVATIIETSHVVLHVWDEIYPSLMQLDVYTCGPLDPKKIVKWLDQFKPSKIDYKYLDREQGLVEIDIK